MRLLRMILMASWFLINCLGLDPGDEAALLTMFNQFESPGTLTWNDGSELCDKQEVTCLADRVRSLNLDDCKLVGTVSSAIGQLTDMTSLSMVGNNLTSLPTEIGLLQNLLTLRLTSNEFETLPNEFGNLPLTSLTLTSNLFTTLPTAVCNLANLVTLTMPNNLLTTLPTEFGNLHSLSTLDFSNNRLSSLPNTMGGLTSLARIDLSFNRFTVFPEELTDVTILGSLKITTNIITEITTKIGQLTSLYGLEIGNNYLKTFPTEIGNCALITLTASLNELESLPAELGDIVSLSTLTLRDNFLIIAPDNLGNTNLLKIDFANNLFIHVPNFLQYLTGAFELNLNDNALIDLPDWLGTSNAKRCSFAHNFIGNVPTGISGLDTLQSLDLTDNLIVTLPTEIGTLTSLTNLIITDNRLISLPSELGLLPLSALVFPYNEIAHLPGGALAGNNLKSLDLSYNKLTKVPTEIGASQLHSADFSYNRLGSLPTEIGDAPLSILNVAHNQIKSVPSSIGKLQNLVTLNLDYNALSHIPETVANCTLLKTLSINANFLTSFPGSFWTLPNLVGFNLGNNSLAGVPPILDPIPSLDSLLLSNNFIPEFPSGIQNLYNLRTLDLSANAIPKVPTEIETLTKLTHLSLAANTIESVPAGVFDITTLEILSLRNNKISQISPKLSQLVNLEDLLLSDNMLVELPSLAPLNKLRTLFLASNYLNCNSHPYPSLVKFTDAAFFNLECKSESAYCHSEIKFAAVWNRTSSLFNTGRCVFGYSSTSAPTRLCLREDIRRYWSEVVENPCQPLPLMELIMLQIEWFAAVGAPFIFFLLALIFILANQRRRKNFHLFTSLPVVGFHLSSIVSEIVYFATLYPIAEYFPLAAIGLALFLMDTVLNFTCAMLIYQQIRTPLKAEKKVRPLVISFGYWLSLISPKHINFIMIFTDNSDIENLLFTSSTFHLNKVIKNVTFVGLGVYGCLTPTPTIMPLIVGILSGFTLLWDLLTEAYSWIFEEKVVKEIPDETDTSSVPSKRLQEFAERFSMDSVPQTEPFPQVDELSYKDSDDVSRTDSDVEPRARSPSTSTLKRAKKVLEPKRSASFIMSQEKIDEGNAGHSLLYSRVFASTVVVVVFLSFLPHFLSIIGIPLALASIKRFMLSFQGYHKIGLDKEDPLTWYEARGMFLIPFSFIAMTPAFLIFLGVNTLFITGLYLLIVFGKLFRLDVTAIRSQISSCHLGYRFVMSCMLWAFLPFFSKLPSIRTEKANSKQHPLFMVGILLWFVVSTFLLPVVGIVFDFLYAMRLIEQQRDSLLSPAHSAELFNFMVLSFFFSSLNIGFFVTKAGIIIRLLVKKIKRIFRHEPQPELTYEAGVTSKLYLFYDFALDPVEPSLENQVTAPGHVRSGRKEKKNLILGVLFLHFGIGCISLAQTVIKVFSVSFVGVADSVWIATLAFSVLGLSLAISVQLTKMAVGHAPGWLKFTLNSWLFAMVGALLAVLCVFYANNKFCDITKSISQPSELQQIQSCPTIGFPLTLKDLADAHTLDFEANTIQGLDATANPGLHVLLFENLGAVSQNFKASHNPVLETFLLSSLRNISSDVVVEFSHNPKLSQLSTDSLENIGGVFKIIKNALFPVFTLPSLLSLQGEVIYEGNVLPVDMHLTKLQRLLGRMTFRNSNFTLADFALLNIVKENGILVFDDNQLPGMVAFPSLSQFEGRIQFNGNTGLRELNFPKIDDNRGVLEFTHNANLQVLDLSYLVENHGRVTISDNTLLNSTDFSALTRCHENSHIRIANNENLETLIFPKLTTLPSTAFNITGNPNLTLVWFPELSVLDSLPRKAFLNNHPDLRVVYGVGS